MSKPGTVLAVLAGIVAVVVVIYFAVFKSTPKEIETVATTAAGIPIEQIPTDTQVSPALVNASPEEQEAAGYTPAPIVAPIASPIVAPLASQQALITLTPPATVDPATEGMMTVTGAASKGIPDGAVVFTHYQTGQSMIWVDNPSQVGGTDKAILVSEYLKGGYRATNPWCQYDPVSCPLGR